VVTSSPLDASGGFAMRCYLANRAVVIGLAFSCLMLAPLEAARASWIGVFTTPDGTGPCSINVQPFTSFNWYILAMLGGDAAAGGISGAQFLPSGYDTAWFNAITPNSPGFILEDYWNACSAQTAFLPCQTESTVLLFSIQSISLTAI